MAQPIALAETPDLSIKQEPNDTSFTLVLQTGIQADCVLHWGLTMRPGGRLAVSSTGVLPRPEPGTLMPTRRGHRFGVLPTAIRNCVWNWAALPHRQPGRLAIVPA